ncbi:MAG: aldo/keto reductase [Verrucomicrobia bacterium]|nr:aldo/keto reductase [Verrucomicrobiota bacterium]
MNRREFLKRSLRATGGSLAATTLTAWPHALFAADKPKLASDRVTLGSGPARLRVSRLAMGTGSGGWNHHSNQTRQLGVRGLADLLRLAYDRGVTFWDSADQYGSHPHLREALRTVPRDQVTILTKTRATTAAEARADLDRFRQELGTDYLDILLLHCLEDGDWPEKLRPVMDVIGEARERGLVRAHGVSCHTLPALHAAARSPWVQVNLARINPAGVIMDADVPTVRGVLRQMKAAGKGVIGMKILGAGQLREHRDEALQYALSLMNDCVDCFTIGSESAAEFTDLTQRIAAAGVRG